MDHLNPELRIDQVQLASAASLCQGSQGHTANFQFTQNQNAVNEMVSNSTWALHEEQIKT